MRRRSLWKLPVAAVAAILLPQAASAFPPPPEVAHPLFVRDETMSGYAILQEIAEAQQSGASFIPEIWSQEVVSHLSGCQSFIGEAARIRAVRGRMIRAPRDRIITARYPQVTFNSAEEGI